MVRVNFKLFAFAGVFLLALAITISNTAFIINISVKGVYNILSFMGITNPTNIRTRNELGFNIYVTKENTFKVTPNRNADGRGNDYFTVMYNSSKAANGEDFRLSLIHYPKSDYESYLKIPLNFKMNMINETEFMLTLDSNIAKERRFTTQLSPDGAKKAEFRITLNPSPETTNNLNYTINLALHLMVVRDTHISTTNQFSLDIDVTKENTFKVTPNRNADNRGNDYFTVMYNSSKAANGEDFQLSLIHYPKSDYESYLKIPLNFKMNMINETEFMLTLNSNIAKERRFTTQLNPDGTKKAEFRITLNPSPETTNNLNYTINLIIYLTLKDDSYYNVPVSLDIAKTKSNRSIVTQIHYDNSPIDIDGILHSSLVTEKGPNFTIILNPNLEKAHITLSFTITTNGTNLKLTLKPSPGITKGANFAIDTANTLANFIIALTPDSKLTNGQKYKIKLNLSIVITDLPVAKPTLTFNEIQKLKQLKNSFEVNIKMKKFKDEVLSFVPQISLPISLSELKDHNQNSFSADPNLPIFESPKLNRKNFLSFRLLLNSVFRVESIVFEYVPNCTCIPRNIEIAAVKGTKEIYISYNYTLQPGIHNQTFDVPLIPSEKLYIQALDNYGNNNTICFPKPRVYVRL